MVWKDAESIFQRRCHERRLCLIIRSLLWAPQEREVGSKGWWEGATSRSTFSPYIAWCVECSSAAYIMKPTGNELDLLTWLHRKKKSRDNVCLAVITRLFDYRGLNEGGVMLSQQMVDLFDPLQHIQTWPIFACCSRCLTKNVISQ